MKVVDEFINERIYIVYFVWSYIAKGVLIDISHASAVESKEALEEVVESRLVRGLVCIYSFVPIVLNANGTSWLYFNVHLKL